MRAVMCNSRVAISFSDRYPSRHRMNVVLRAASERVRLTVTLFDGVI